METGNGKRKKTNGILHTHTYSHQSKEEILKTLGVFISIICQAITRSVPLAVLPRLS